MKKSTGLLSFLVLFTAAAPAETPRSVINALHRAIVPSAGAAERSVDDLRHLTNELPQLQLIPPDEVSDLSRGQPFPIVVVDLDRLRTFDPAAEPAAALLVPTNRAFYFVATSNDTAVSGVEVMKEDAEWFPARLGLTSLAMDVQTTIAHFDIKASDAVLIEIPAFRVWLVGYDDNGVMKVAAVQDVPELEIAKNVSLPLEAVLRNLVQPARRHNGLSS